MQCNLAGDHPTLFYCHAATDTKNTMFASCVGSSFTLLTLPEENITHQTALPILCVHILTLPAVLAFEPTLL